MSLPSIVSYGAAAKTSTLVWDGDLVIPDGYAIESASGEVGIVGDVSISGGANIAGSITHPVFPTTVSLTETPNINGMLVLETERTDTESVLWGYKGAFYVSGNANGNITGLNLDTGHFVTLNVAPGNVYNLNMFIIKVTGDNTSLRTNSLKNIIL